jgi:photosystem II stability/assembly factor-like uncharacterized protein
MKTFLKKFLSSSAAISLAASILTVVPVVVLSDSALAVTLDNTRFARAKVTSTFKNNGGTAYASCYGTSGTCTMQRSSSYEWSLPDGGYFKLERSVNPSWPWRVLSCSFGGSCEVAQTIGKIYAFKPGQYFIYRSPNASYNWVFSLGFLSPYTFALGSDISWSFDASINGSEGEYISAPSRVTSAINGQGAVGVNLTASSTHVGVDGQVSYQWKRSSQTTLSSFTNISGAVNDSYTTTNDDGDKYIRLTVTVSNFFGSSSATSDPLKIAVPTKLDPTFSSTTSGYGKFSVNVTNYDAAFTYSASATNGVATLGTAVGTTLPITVSGLTSSQQSTLTITTERTGYPSGSGTVAGSALASAITTESGPVGRWIASSISKDGTSFLVANQGGYLYRSNDNGVNWERLPTEVDNEVVTRNWSGITQSIDGQKIFATSAGGKIYKSINAGATWTQVALKTNWRAIACNDDCMVVVAATSGGNLWRSVDMGQTWDEVASARNWRQVSISATGAIMSGVVYGGKVYVSTDFGNTWAESATTDNWIDTKLTENGSVVYALTASGKIFSSNTNALNLTQYVITGPGAALALDWGATGGNSGLIACGSNGGIYAHQGEGLEVGLVAANPTPWNSCATSSNNGKIIATSTTGLIYISTNSGTNWTARSISSGNINRRALVASENGTQIYSAIYGGEIEYSTDSGATWSTALNNDENWIAIAASANFQKIYAVAYQGYIYQSQDSGATWQKVNFPKLPWISIAVSANGAKAVAATKGGNIYNTNDSGESWTPRDQRRKWVSVASSSNGDKFAAVVEGGFVYTSSNGGDNWTQRGSERNWSAIASSSNGNKLVATVARGKIYTSTDSGVTWTARASERNWLNVVSSTSGNRLIAVVGTGKIYTSANSGGTWTARENNRNWRALYLTGNGNRAFAADFGRKLYRSTDSGESWTAL